MLPLPQNMAHRTFDRGNCGLRWNKFVNTWPSRASAPLCEGDNADDCFKSLGGKQKTKWISEFVCTIECHDAEARCKFLKDLAGRLGGRAEAFITTAPFVTGLGLEHPVENGFLWHHTLGVPYLPGSSIKGMTRAWAEHWLEEDSDTINRLFGPRSPQDASTTFSPAVGDIIFFDALPQGKLELMAEVITPHDGGWRNADDGSSAAPSDWISPVPIPFLAIVPGATFCFAIAPRPGVELPEGDLDTVMKWIAEALKWTGAGARTSTGFGRFLNLQTHAQEQQRLQKLQQDMANCLQVGDYVTDTEGETGTIRQIKGSIALVEIMDEIYEISLDELRRVKK